MKTSRLGMAFDDVGLVPDKDQLGLDRELPFSLDNEKMELPRRIVSLATGSITDVLPLK